MNGKNIIYAAGNPRAYPLEYYDYNTKTYKGVIPSIFEKFSQNSNYEIIYYEPSVVDKRNHFAKNKQVDILSGYTNGDKIPYDAQKSILFKTEDAGKEIEYHICFTDVASSEFKLKLETFISTMSDENIMGMLVETSKNEIESNGLYFTIGGLLLAIAVLASAIGIIVSKYKKKLKSAVYNLEVDDITGLGNIDYFEKYYKQYVNEKNRILYSLIYFYVDTERLLRVGSTEELRDFLKYCSIILLEYAKDNDILAKVSDQGFALLGMFVDNESIIDRINPIFDRIKEFTVKYSKPYDVDISAGIYNLKKFDIDINEILFNAAQGAYMAERTQEKYIICSDKFVRKLVEDKQLQAGLEKAFSNKEFKLYIQFYVDAKTYKIVGGEALSRWNHPQKGVLSPGFFVPLMEREHLISKLDYYCFEEVCRFLSMLHKNNVDSFFISCNFSRETFVSVDFVENCQKIISKYEFPKELLIFEITESARVKNISQIQENILKIKQMGISISLDDFGEGFTSFYDLNEYSFDGIKLDKGLIDKIDTKSGRAIVRAMIQVGHDLGMTTLAEGVEKDEQVEILQDLDCDVIQGFKFYYPLPDWEAKNKILEKY